VAKAYSVLQVPSIADSIYHLVSMALLPGRCRIGTPLLWVVAGGRHGRTFGINGSDKGPLSRVREQRI
jgi:hypothetical protein